MKNLIVICFLFVFANLFSQKTFKSGKVVYSVKITPEMNSQRSLLLNGFGGFKRKMDNFSEKVKYTLEFNKENSLFYMNTDLALENEEGYSQLALVLNRADHVYFVDIKQKITIEQKPFLGDDFLVQSSSSDLEWKMINETKVIGDYTCYKATVKRRNNGPLKEEDRYSTYTAWYCPDISYNYGPFDFNNLPGLILELSIMDKSYIATTVEFNDNVIVLSKPTKGKLMTKEEFDKIGEKAFKNR